MSISTIQNTIRQLQKDLEQLQKQLSDETKKEADKSHKRNYVRNSITKNINPTTLKNKLREIDNLTEDIGRVQKKQSEINSKITDKTTRLHKAQEDLRKEQERERKKTEEAEKKNYQDQIRRQKELTQQLTEQRRLAETLTSQLPYITTTSQTPVKYDVFISHASEDKEEFVRPLAEQLQALGFQIWYDEFTLKVGDSLRQSIDQGLRNSRYGIVVFSSAFFAKQWPQYELDGLVAREMRGVKVILPIWHKVTKDDVVNYSPSLAGKMALNSSILSVAEIAQGLAEVLRGS